MGHVTSLPVHHSYQTKIQSPSLKRLRENSASLSCRWKQVGESLLAMYRHQTTCPPPRPSLGRRIDLSEYRDPNFLQNLPAPSSPVSVGPTTVLSSSSPSSSLPPVALSEPPPGSTSLPLFASSQATVEITTTTTPTAQPAGQWNICMCVLCVRVCIMLTLLLLLLLLHL